MFTPSAYARARLLQGAMMMQHAASCAAAIDAAAAAIADALRRGNKLLLRGDAGSLVECEQLTAEFNRLPFGGSALPAVALKIDAQLEAIGHPGDVLLAIAMNGCVVDTLRVMDCARSRSMRTVALIRASDGDADRADVVVRVPGHDRHQLQQAYMAIGHVLCELVESELCDQPPREVVVDVERHPYFAQKHADASTQLRVNAAVLLRDAHGRILLEKRTDCQMWGMPGGRIEPGESVCAAARREILEETGLEIRVTRLLGVYSGPIDRIVSFPDNVVQVIDVLVEGEVVSGEFVLSAESEAMEFFPLSALPPESAIIPPARCLLDDVVSGRTGMVR